MRKELIEYLPSVLKEILEYQIITKAEQPEIDRLKEQLQETYDNQFYDLARLSGVERYEEILNIIPGAEDSLDLRRLRIKSRMTMQLPYSIRVLRSKLVQLFGEGNFDLLLRNEIYELIVRSDLANAGQMKILRQLLSEMVPCNLWIVYGNQSGTQTIIIFPKIKTALRVRMPFSARRSVALRRLDGAWLLDGSWLLDGLSGNFVDWYPTKARITMPVRAAPKISSRAVIEKNYKTLDGTWLLDGSQILNASRVEMEV